MVHQHKQVCIGPSDHYLISLRLGMLVLLLGLRCSGKTTLAPLLAKKIGCDWSDLDMLVMTSLKSVNVHDAWTKHGVGAFRDTEARCLASLLQDALRRTNPLVLALGGGTPTAPGAAALMQDARTKGHALTIYLRAKPQTLQQRLRAASGDPIANRPSLTGEDPILEVPKIFLQRDPLYLTLADVVVQVDECSIDEAMQKIESELDRQGRISRQ